MKMDELIQHFKNLEEDETLKRIDDAYNRGWNDAMNNPEVKKALDRMEPKKVVCRHFNKYYGNEIGDCPNCLCTIEDESELNGHPHCKYCGQALDWSE